MMEQQISRFLCSD
uniref:Uncharacterized protein n=1 Tax=Arundo donax TaxID=35708 RepID=A0A0A9BDS6_ARUDO